MGCNYLGKQLAGWKFSWVKIFQVGIILGGNFQGGNCPGGSCPGREFSEWELSWLGIFLRGNFPDGNFLVGTIRVAIFWVGVFLVPISQRSGNEVGVCVPRPSALGPYFDRGLKIGKSLKQSSEKTFSFWLIPIFLTRFINLAAITLN